jgi:endonuclease-3
MIQSTDMEKYGPIYAALVDAYGEPTWRPSLPPVDELISTILSQNTNDTNRDTAFERLRDRFGSWEAVRDADASKVVEAIRPAGLANQKAPRIQQALREITDQAGKISLDFLQDMSVDEAKSWLTGLHGVGPKTAAIVLLFGMGRPAFPVDTHVHRSRPACRPRRPTIDLKRSSRQTSTLPFISISSSTAGKSASPEIPIVGGVFCKSGATITKT